MEPVGALSEINWSTFNGTLSTDEAEFMSQLLGSCPFMDEQDCDPSFGIPGTVWSGHTATGDDDSYFCSSDMFNSSIFTPIPDYENHNAGDANGVQVMCSNSSTMDVYVVDGLDASSLLRATPDTPFEEGIYLNEETNDNNLGEPGAKPSEHILPSQKAQPKRKFELLEMKKATLVKTNIDPSENQKKKIRVSEQVQRNGKNTKSKKNAKVVVIAEEESKAALNGQSSSGDLSEDDSNASQEINCGASSSSRGAAALNTNGKTRAGRGSATDPQSLYARKRRERINERLRILQNLVPNGTKVDISTMLEEAVDYVKFLQLQIKLLSSDDLWMYAPIAYNGINIGLDLKISPP